MIKMKILTMENEDSSLEKGWMILHHFSQPVAIFVKIDEFCIQNDAFTPSANSTNDPGGEHTQATLITM